MKQLVQNLKTGEMKSLDVPIPDMGEKNILVRVYYSLISAGTEAGKVSMARKGYLGKAKEKPDQVKQVLDTMKKEGFTNTYRKVMNKLDAWAPLGYSCSGQVVAVGAGVNTVKVGDYAACAGQDIANHAQIVSVPQNLCAKIPKGVSLQNAAFTTVAAIALQGVRQADLRLGENCLVVGLGLIGQLTVQYLKAAGVSVAGIDIDKNMAELAKKSNIDLTMDRFDDQVEEAIINFSNGYGVDAVIITAATSSLDPVELAGRVSRHKGRVIIVGAVPTGFSRDTYYKKELELRMATSYGPGRYNPNYEEKGLDYPYGYVRWTENRNMQAYLNLLAQKKMDISTLTSHTFKLDEAHKAFELILARSEPFVGILLEYESKPEIEEITSSSDLPVKSDNSGVGFIGAGSFAQTFLLPNIKDVNFTAVATSDGHSSQTVADRYGFSLATGSAEDVINHPQTDMVFIATRHDTHARFVKQALEKDKHVFVEKPLCLKESELEEIKNLYNSKDVHLMVGFNRRFAPLLQKIKSALKKDYPVAINYRVNAGAIPPEHWTQDADIGGGRIIGEVCHFVDLAMYLSASFPKTVSAQALDDPQNLMDTLAVNLEFENGSIATVNYFSNGPKSMPKEYLEVFSLGAAFVLNDFKSLDIYGKSKKSHKLMNQDKGHKNEVNKFIHAVINGTESPIPFNEIYLSSLLPFKIIESIQKRKTIIL